MANELKPFKPLIEANVEDAFDATVALTGDKNILVKYFSNAYVTMSAKAQSGAAINEDMYIIRNGDETIYGTYGWFYNVESNVFTFSAEDSLGRIGTSTLKPTMIDYIKPTCYMGSSRPDGSGEMVVTCYGKFFNDTFGAVNNTITARYRYKELGGAWSDYVTMSVTLSGNDYYAYATLSGLDYKKAYSVEVEAKDKLSRASDTVSNIRSVPGFHWGENDFVFEVPVTFNAGTSGATIDSIEGDLNVKGNMRLKGSGNYGNILYFGDGSYCYISEPTDDAMTIHASKITLDASSGVYVEGKAIPILEKGTWSPSLNSSAVSYYTTQYGWYMKMGQTVTVGFCVKATCNSGYNGTAISISGLPFTPMFTATGGGMCSGAYVSAGKTFQCYAAETSGNITTRVQDCDRASAANLTTSASGCYYRASGGEITLSGTITFMANS